MSNGYECRLLPDEPIVLTTFYANFDVKHDAPKLIEQMKAIFDSATEPLYMLDDMLEMKLTFSDLVAAMALSTKGDVAPLRHPNVRKLIAVTNNDLIRFGGNALKQTQYGVSNVDVFSTVEEALKSIRAEVAARQKSPT